MSFTPNMHTPLSDKTSARVNQGLSASSSSLLTTKLVYDENREPLLQSASLRRLTFPKNGSNEDFYTFYGNGFNVINFIDGRCKLRFDDYDHQAVREADGVFSPPSDNSHARGRKRALKLLTQQTSHDPRASALSVKVKRRKKNEVCGGVYVGVCVQSRKFIHSICKHPHSNKSSWQSRRSAERSRRYVQMQCMRVLVRVWTLCLHSLYYLQQTYVCSERLIHCSGVVCDHRGARRQAWS
jgi:hypothetical protein